ncbi:MAG: SRPBCC domain-containing protein [Vicinamibacterales bacterium]
MTSLRIALVSLLVLAGVSAASAQVGTTGFKTRVQKDIRATPEKVYAAFLQIGQWWSPGHTYSGDASNLSLEARPGGCFCERLPNGGGVEHLRVVYLAPGEAIRLSGALGPLQALGVNGSLTVEFKAASTRTVVEMTYAVGGFSEGGFNQLAPAVTGVLTEQMNRLQSFIETGRLPRN